MNLRSSHERTAPVVLAHQLPFRLGPLMIEPPMRRISHEDGREEIVEQRVMQVLVAMARAEGDILSRDDLVSACWDGRIVGDDAINRVMSRLRRVASGIGDGAFRIETITKVGYRLTRAPVLSGGGTAGPIAHAGAAESGPRRRRFAPFAALVGLIAVVVAVAAFLLVGRPASPAVPAVAVIGGDGPGAHAMARTLSNDLARLAGARADQLAVVDPADRSDADFVVRVDRERRGGLVTVHLDLTSPDDPQILWSARLERPPGEEPDLAEQMSAKLGRVLLCASDARRGETRLDQTTMRLFLVACDQLNEPASEQRRRLLQQIAQRAPRFAWAWATLAQVEAAMAVPLLARGGQDLVAQASALRGAARRHLGIARSLDPANGSTYAAEAELGTFLGNWGERLALIERGLERDPDHAPLHEMRAALLNDIGRDADAVASMRRAAELEPASAPAQSRLAITLAYTGRTAAAWRVLDQLERIWPNAAVSRDARFRLELRYGDPARALRITEMDETRGIPGDLSPPSERAYLLARLDPSPARIEAALRAMQRPGLHSDYLQALVEFGRLEEAYRLTGPDRKIDALRTWPDVLFRPNMAPFRNDRRFLALTARFGLLQYWQSSGRWPDFCGEPALPYDCRAEARRLLASSR